MDKNHTTITSLAFVLFLLNIIGDSNNYFYADDSLPFAIGVAEGAGFNSHHLILGILSRLSTLFGLTSPGDFAGGLAVMKVYVAATSFLALFIIGVMALRWFGTLTVALITMMATAFSYGFWSYSIVTDLYVPATAFTLLAIYFADKSYDDGASLWLMLPLSIVAALLASLNHQAYSVVVFPIALVLLVRPTAGRARRGDRAALYLAGSGISGLGLYYAIYVAAQIKQPFTTYVSGYASWMKMMPYDSFQPLTPLYAAVGVLRTIAFPEYALHFDAAYAKAHAQFPLKALFDEVFLLAEFSSATVALLAGLTALLYVVLGLLIVSAVRSAYRNPPRHPGLWMVLGWVIAQTAVSVWWEPTSNEFWIWLMPCLSLLVTGLVVQSRSAGLRRVLPWTFVILLFAVNAPVISRYWKSENCVYRANKTYLAKVHDQDLVITGDMYPVRNFTMLHNPNARALDFHFGAFSINHDELGGKLDAQIGRVKREGGRVILDPLIAMPEETEINLMHYFAQTRTESVAEQLQELESLCERMRIPLYAVVRKDRGVIPFERREFRGHLKWVDADLNPVAQPTG